MAVTHTTDDPHEEEGFVQKAQVSLMSAVQHNQKLYVSLWAHNKVSVSNVSHPTYQNQRLYVSLWAHNKVSVSDVDRPTQPETLRLAVGTQQGECL